MSSQEKKYTEEERDIFAMSYAVWLMYDPQAKLYQAAGATSWQLLEKYKSRPYIDMSPEKN